MLVTNVNLATAVKKRKNEESSKLWPEEEKALKDIMTGKDNNCQWTSVLETPQRSNE